MEELLDWADEKGWPGMRGVLLGLGVGLGWPGMRGVKLDANPDPKAKPNP